MEPSEICVGPRERCLLCMGALPSAASRSGRALHFPYISNVLPSYK